MNGETRAWRGGELLETPALLGCQSTHGGPRVHMSCVTERQGGPGRLRLARKPQTNGWACPLPALPSSLPPPPPPTASAEATPTGTSRGGPALEAGERWSLCSAYRLSPKPSGDLLSLFLPLGDRATCPQPCHLLPAARLGPLPAGGPRRGGPCPSLPVPLSSLYSLPQPAFGWDRGAYFCICFLFCRQLWLSALYVRSGHCDSVVSQTHTQSCQGLAGVLTGLFPAGPGTKQRFAGGLSSGSPRATGLQMPCE